MGTLLALILAIVLPVGAAPMKNAAAPSNGDSHGRSPAVVENGTDLELFAYPEGHQLPFAFAPDGSAYAIYNSYNLIKVAPDGATSLIKIDFPVENHATRYGEIIYADGYLWFDSFEGYIHMKPDGTNVTYHQQAFLEPVAAPNGIFISLYGAIEFINGTTFVRTVYPLPHAGYPAYKIVGPDGRLYFDYTAAGAKSDGLARLEPNGTFTFFRGRNGCGPPQLGFVNARNAIYFIGASSGTPGVRLCRVTYVGTFAALSAPYSQFKPAYYSGLNIGISADSDGNVWTSNVLGSGLYSYSASTGTTVGPIEYGTLNQLGGFLTVGPDQNVWTYGYYATDKLFFGAYVRHLMTFLPTSVSLLAAAPASDFYVTEPVKSAPWTAYSLNPAIATVSPASSIVGRFKVTSVAAGSTSIVVTDVYGNVRSEPVTVTSTVP